MTRDDLRRRLMETYSTPTTSTAGITSDSGITSQFELVRTERMATRVRRKRQSKAARVRISKAQRRFWWTVGLLIHGAILYFGLAYQTEIREFLVSKGVPLIYVKVDNLDRDRQELGYVDGIEMK